MPVQMPTPPPEFANSFKVTVGWRSYSQHFGESVPVAEVIALAREALDKLEADTIASPQNIATPELGATPSMGDA